MPVITIEDARLSYRLEGDEQNPVLILSNALCTDIEMWTLQVPDLLSRFRVLRYDTRGLGSSDAPRGEYTMECLGRDVLALADALQIKKFAFAGLSLGGMIGNGLAQTRPSGLPRSFSPILRLTLRRNPTGTKGAGPCSRAEWLPSWMWRWGAFFQPRCFQKTMYS